MQNALILFVALQEEKVLDLRVAQYCIMKLSAEYNRE